METLSVVVVSLLKNVNDTHKKGLDFKKKSIDNKISSIKEFHKMGKYLTELKRECKSLGISFIETMEKETKILGKTSQRWRELSRNERLSSLIESENGDRLKGINNLGLMKLLDISNLSDTDFETVVNGNDTPLNKDISSDSENENTPSSDNKGEKETPPSDSSGDNKSSPSIPTEFIDTLGNDYLTLIKSDKDFLVLRISNEIVENKELKKEIVDLKLQLDNLSPQGEV